MLSPIRQCPNGHVLCDRCSQTPECSFACPQCRAHPTNIRNLALEILAEGIEIECGNAASGCKALIKYSDAASHMAVCEFKPIRCPCEGCIDMLPLNAPMIVNHLVTKHSCSVKQMSAQEDPFVWETAARNTTGVDDCTWPIRILDANGMFFLFRLRVDARRYLCCIQRVATKSESSSSRYEVSIEHNGRSLRYKAPTRSIADSFETIVNDYDCFEVSKEMGHRLSGNASDPLDIMATGELLQLTVRIWITNAEGCRDVG